MIDIAFKIIETVVFIFIIKSVLECMWACFQPLSNRGPTVDAVMITEPTTVWIVISKIVSNNKLIKKAECIYLNQAAANDHATCVNFIYDCQRAANHLTDKTAYSIKCDNVANISDIMKMMGLDLDSFNFPINLVGFTARITTENPATGSY